MYQMFIILFVKLSLLNKDYLFLQTCIYGYLLISYAVHIYTDPAAKRAVEAVQPGLEVIKKFQAQLSMKFQLLINVEIIKNCGKYSHSKLKN